MDGVRAALRSGLREPDIDLLPPGGDAAGATDRSAGARRRVALETHDGTPLGSWTCPRTTSIRSSRGLPRGGPGRPGARRRDRRTAGADRRARGVAVEVPLDRRARAAAPEGPAVVGTAGTAAGPRGGTGRRVGGAGGRRRGRGPAPPRGGSGPAGRGARRPAPPGARRLPRRAQPVRPRGRPARSCRRHAGAAPRGRLAARRSETPEPGGRGGRLLRRRRGRTHRRRRAGRRSRCRPGTGRQDRRRALRRRPPLATFAATDEARRVTALGGIVGEEGADAVRIRVPGVAAATPVPAVTEAGS